MSNQYKNTAAGVGAVGGAVLNGGSAVGTVGGAAVGGVISHEVIVVVLTVNRLAAGPVMPIDTRINRLHS